MKFGIFGALTALALTACASAPKDFSFDRTKNALIVLAVPNEAAKTIDEFRRVDLATKQFVESGYVRIETSTAWLSAKPSNWINDGRLVLLLVQEVAPGDYALQQSTRAVTNGVRDTWGKVCFSKLSPVYSLVAGEIALIRVDQTSVSQSAGEWRTPTTDPVLLASGAAAVLKEFERARADYPGLSGDAKMIEPDALIRWPASENCSLPPSFEVVSRRTAQ